MGGLVGAGAAGSAGSARTASTYLSAQREGFCGSIPRRAAEGLGSSSRLSLSGRGGVEGRGGGSSGSRLSPPRSRTLGELPEPDDGLNA